MAQRTDLDGEREIRQALEPFGWDCGPEFWKRYYQDPWVFNLTNAVVRLTAALSATDGEGT